MAIAASFARTSRSSNSSVPKISPDSFSPIRRIPVISVSSFSGTINDALISSRCSPAASKKWEALGSRTASSLTSTPSCPFSHWTMRLSPRTAAIPADSPLVVSSR